MARLPSSFNARESDKLGELSVIPAGEYVAHIVKSEMKETKDKSGSYLQLQFTVLEGEQAGKSLFLRLNLQNQNAQTVEIAYKVLATICEICGVDVLEDSEDLHNVPMMITVIEKEGNAQYPKQNDIRGYAAIEGAVRTAPAPSAPVRAPAQSGGKTPPWKK